MTDSDLLRAVRALWGARVRSALTLFGIILGTSSLVLLVALLDGGRDALVATNQEASESDVVVVRSVEPPHAQRHRTRRELSRTDARALGASRALGEVWVGSERGQMTWARFGERSKRVTVASAVPETTALYRLSVARGRFLDEVDLERRAHICVVGHEVAGELFAGESALGKALTIDGDVWRVVGVLADKPMLGSTDSTQIWNRKVLVPESSFDATYNPKRGAEKLTLRPRASAVLQAPLRDLRRLLDGALLRRHFGVRNFDAEPSRDAGQGELILTILRVLLFGATLISLGVSGINVMNVMLVSVSERTVEIGIRRAVGASPARIRRQFSCEALVLTGFGGLLGISLGAALAWVATRVLERVLGSWTLHIEPWAMGVAFGLSLLIGLVFGTYPALRAARLDVVAALRNE